MAEAVQITLYLSEADEWHHRPLHIEILKMLENEGVAGGTVMRGVAGFTGKRGIHTATLVDAGGMLPLVVQFVDTVEHVERVLPRLREMAPHRLITKQPVEAYS